MTLNKLHKKRRATLQTVADFAGVNRVTAAILQGLPQSRCRYNQNSILFGS